MSCHMHRIDLKLGLTPFPDVNNPLAYLQWKFWTKLTPGFEPPNVKIGQNTQILKVVIASLSDRFQYGYGLKVPPMDHPPSFGSKHVLEGLNLRRL